MIKDSPETAAERAVATDEWLSIFERIYYFTQNHERSAHQILSRVYEAVLNLQKAAIKRRNYDECRTEWLPKLFAWYCALLRSLGIKEITKLAWSKFPGICPFCMSEQCRCSQSGKGSIDRKALAQWALDHKQECPRTLGEWQTLFNEIYRQEERGIDKSVNGLGERNGDRLLTHSLLKLYEELTELSEAIRLRPFFPDNLNNEVVDVFGSICGLANVLPTSFGGAPRLDLGVEVWRRYPDICDTCYHRVCNCRHRAEQERLSKEGVRNYERRDSKTGLYNHEQYLIDRRRLFALPADEVVAEMFFDCDNFKRFNDETPGGHQQGDAVLRQVAVTAKEAAEPFPVYRDGEGDEFSVLIHDDSDDNVRAVAMRVFESLMKLEVPCIVNPRDSYPVSISAGVAFRTREMEAADDLHRLADETQYLAKNSGKGRIHFSVETQTIP